MPADSFDSADIAAEFVQDNHSPSVEAEPCADCIFRRRHMSGLAQSMASICRMPIVSLKSMRAMSGRKLFRRFQADLGHPARPGLGVDQVVSHS